MTTSWKALLLLFLSASISIAWAWSIQGSSQAGLADFRAIYYGARCVLQQRDPYRADDFQSVYRDSGGTLPADPALALRFNRAVPICVNLPTALLLLVPLALMPWHLAHGLWFILEAASLVIAAYLAVDLAGKDAPRVSLLFACFLLANCEIVLSQGNLAAIVVSACVAAVWCVQKGTWGKVGILLLALALTLKPHDAGPIWLCLVLLPGLGRRSAIKSLVLAVMFGLLSLVWIGQAAPSWLPELSSNLLLTSARGDLNDPGPASLTGWSPGMIIDLQSVLSYFRDDRAFYNLVSYLICGSLLMVWLIATIRARGLQRHGHLALAVVIPLLLLITYHRVHDAKLLLLTIPAFAVLWAEGGLVKWLAFLIHGLTFLLCGDITLSLLLVVESKLHLAFTGWTGTMLKVLLERPIPLALLAMAIFYLVVYVRRVGSTAMEPVAPVAS